MTGAIDSDRPVRPGVTRQSVRAALGEADSTSQNGRDEYFTYRSYKWWVFCMIPLGHFWGDMSPTEYVYELMITFDDRDYVQSLTLKRRLG